MNPSDLQKAELLTRQRLQELSNDPNNIVYEYVYDTPDNPKDSGCVRELFKNLRNAHRELLEKHPTWTDENCRMELLEVPRYVDFRQSHPKMFDAATSRDTTSEQIKYILYMIYMLEQQERKTINPYDATQQVKAFLIEKFSRGAATPEEIQRAKDSNQYQQSA